MTQPNYDRAARMAYKTLLALNIRTLPVDPLMVLSYCKNTAVHTYDDIMNAFGVSDSKSFKFSYADGADAVTVSSMVGGVPRYEVFYDRRAHALRLRFTLAHELGHIILKHSMEQDAEEKEADYFASQLLMPHPIIDFCRKSGAQLDRGALAGLFVVSDAAAACALKNPLHAHDDELYTQVARLFMPGDAPVSIAV